MSWSYPINLARSHLLFTPVLVLDVKAAGNAIADVFHLTALRVNRGLDAFRPAPAGLEGVSADLPAGKVNQFHSGLLWRSAFVR